MRVLGPFPPGVRAPGKWWWSGRQQPACVHPDAPAKGWKRSHPRGPQAWQSGIPSLAREDATGDDANSPFIAGKKAGDRDDALVPAERLEKKGWPEEKHDRETKEDTEVLGEVDVLRWFRGFSPENMDNWVGRGLRSWTIHPERRAAAFLRRRTRV